MHSLLATLVLALSLAAAPAQAPPAQKPPEKKAKKVWTNDDIDLLRGAPSGTAVSGAPAVPETAAGEKPAEKEKPLASEKDPKTYREKLVPLRAQLAQLDAQIKQMRDLLTNPTQASNVVDLRHTSVTMRPEVSLNELEQKRRQLQQKISDLEDEARRNGIASGDIR
jgi:chromosome segregation ATPase